MSALFRSFRVWQLDAPWTRVGEGLAAALESSRFIGCGPGQAESMGWVDVLEDHGLQREISGASVLRVRIQERAVSGKALTEALEERVQEVEHLGGETVFGARRRELADEVRATLLARAPTQSTRHWLVIDREQGLVMIDSPTASTGEAILSLLRGAVGSLPLRPLAFAHPIDGALTSWVRTGDLPRALEIGRWCDLEHPEDTPSKVRFRGYQLDKDEVTAALDSRLRVTALELIVDVGVNEPLHLTLSEDGAFRRVRMPWEPGGSLEEETPLSRVDADLTLVVLGLRHLFGVLFPALGGRIA